LELVKLVRHQRIGDVEFVGATLLALGYQIFMLWVSDRPDSDSAEAKKESGTAS
jgi:hypothetical protein